MEHKIHAIHGNIKHSIYLFFMTHPPPKQIYSLMKKASSLFHHVYGNQHRQQVFDSQKFALKPKQPMQNLSLVK